jgi:fibronectin-binding autotransporter adhesin
MKMNTKSTSAIHRARLFINRMSICALLALIAPLAAMAQQVVFNDVFTNGSTVGLVSTPGGTPTASSTSYDIATPKGIASLDSIGCGITNGQFNLAMIGTSSAVIEGSAIFTTHPVTLAIPGDTIDIQYIFTATTNLFTNPTFGSASFALGLFNSGGSAPDTNMFNSGLVSTTTTEAIGHAQNWLGYRCNMVNTGAGATSTRPAQNQGNNLNQALIGAFTGGANLGQNANGVIPSLTIGNQYTFDYKITLQTNGSLAMTNTFYVGVGTGGAVLATNNASASGANILTTNFDALVVGGTRNSSTTLPTTNFINQIIVTFISSNQAGPYFTVTSSGNPCSGGVDVGLNGSVTTNAYYLYTNGINTGVPLAGTGSALDFGPQTIPANYTVIASNTITAHVGPMYGSANVFASGITMNTEPSSVTLVTNLPASFIVSATGAALSYQWYQNGAPLTNNANISGATSATLNFAAAGATNVGSYTVVIQDPCGDIITSTPPATLTLVAPRNLTWAGGNPGSDWNYTDQNFTVSGSPTAFAAGDNVTFDDSSSFTSVTISNNLTPTLVSVVGAQTYTFSGPIGQQITGVSRLAMGGTATLTILNSDNFTGGTIVSNGATLSIGNGTGITGSLAGTVTVSNTGTLNYSSSASSVTTVINILNSFAGNGTINFNDAAGATYATGANLVSSNFNGTINIQGFTRLHASDGNAGFPLGNGSTVNVPANTQAFLDRSTTAYNNIFNIAGNGWQGVTPTTGAMSIFGNTINGPINLTDNARIGGTINGGTIQSVISGPFQLEVWGNTNSYVLIMGPTNGLPQAYASTLITSGSIQAANSNAISTGPLTLDSGGDLRLFGNNLTVSNLSSINSGQILLVEGPRIRNMNTTNAATLTVGADGTSTEFDGTFSDGTNAAFGLTKVGAGTLTLTSVNTNTGAVTINGGTIAMSGSGSFAKASQIIANNGGSYDVTGVGGTLTLNSGQTLRGNGGTVNGALVASAGSTVAPGLPMGTLTVSGNATVSGIYRPNLNRTNTPSNHSTFTSSGGSITFSGATLSVTNVGQALQVGDTFQLFPGATAGFTTIALQTNDIPNNANYTWNNTVATDGKITVASVVSRVLILQTVPTASAIVFGQALSNSVVSGGSVTNSAGAAVAGTFAFTTPTNRPNAGTASQSVTFTPTDLVNYNPTIFSVSVTVNPQTPVLKTTPTASTITNGQPLSASILTGGVVTNAFSTNVVAGTFAFTTPAVIPGVGTSPQSVTFSPTDTANFNSFTFNVNVTVVTASSGITALQFTAAPAVSGTNLTISVTNTGAGTFYLLNNTNVASARNNWKPLWTNVAAGSSSFTTTVTNAVNPALGQQFYILSTTNNQ